MNLGQSLDRHANFVNSLAVLAGVLERIAVEIRHLQRTEVLEVEEPFYKNQIQINVIKISV